MRRWIVGVMVLVILATGGCTASQSDSPSSSDNPEAETVEEEQAISIVTDRVVADARLRPVRRAALSLTTGGIVDKLMVTEGDTVETGQLLLRLVADQQQVAVARAQADLRRAEARLAEIKAGPRTQEIRTAEAALNAAQARYDRLAAASLPGDIAAAEASVSSSQAGLAKVLEGISEQQLIAARADLANAEATLRQAQRAYDRVKWRNDIGALPESAALQQATNNFEAAQARLADLQSGPSQADVANASAQVRRAQAQLDTLRAAMPADLVAAEADVESAQAQLELLQAGTRAETIAVAEAEVAAATTALQQALVTLGETELRAPFAGTIAELTIEPGEQASAGAILIQLADLNEWEVETEDLTELEVVGLAPGDQVELSFDAIPDLTMPGTIKRVRPIGEDNRGDIVYTVLLAPAETDDRFLWNMTTAVTLER